MKDLGEETYILCIRIYKDRSRIFILDVWNATGELALKCFTGTSFKMTSMTLCLCLYLYFVKSVVSSNSSYQETIAHFINGILIKYI